MFMTIRVRNARHKQNISLDECYLLFEEYLQKTFISVYILKPCREIGRSLEELKSRGGKLRNLEFGLSFA